MAEAGGRGRHLGCRAWARRRVARWNASALGGAREVLSRWLRLMSRPGGCCRGCRSASASASSSTSPRIASRRSAACADAWPGAFAVAAVLARARPVAFPLLLALAAVAAGFATVTLKSARVAHPVLQHAAWNVAISGFVEVREERERSDRIVVRVHSIEGAAARRAGARAGLGEEAHGAAGRHLRRGEGAAQPAAAAAAPGRLRFRARPLFPAHRRDRLCARRDQDRSSRRCRRAHGCATRPSSKACATRSTSASARRAGRCGLDRVRADHRQARRDLGAGERRDVHLRPRPCAVDLRLPHGGGGGRHVLRGARAARAVAGAGDAPSDQEMGGARGADRGVLLSAAVRRGGRDAALLHHDRRSCSSA